MKSEQPNTFHSVQPEGVEVTARKADIAPGSIGRIGAFLYQLDDGTLENGLRINLWSGHLHPNNCYPPTHAERAAVLFEAAPDLLAALQRVMSYPAVRNALECDDNDAAINAIARAQGAS